MTKEEAEFQRLQKRVEILQYLLEKRDSSIREAMQKANLSLFKNVDTGNLAVLEAELKNLELGKNPTNQERGRIQWLRNQIAKLKNSGEVGGNPNTQQRPDRK